MISVLRVCGSQRGCNLNSDEYLRSICSYATCRIVAGRNPPSILFESDVCARGTSLGCRFGWPFNPLQHPVAAIQKLSVRVSSKQQESDSSCIPCATYVQRFRSGNCGAKRDRLVRVLSASITIERRECSSDGCLVQLWSDFCARVTWMKLGTVSY